MGHTLSVFLIVFGRVKVEPWKSDIFKAWERFYAQQTPNSVKFAQFCFNSNNYVSILPLLGTLMFQCWASVEGGGPILSLLGTIIYKSLIETGVVRVHQAYYVAYVGTSHKF